MIVTSGFLTDLKCTKFVFGRGSDLDPTGGAYSIPPDPLAFLLGPTSKKEGKKGDEKGRRRRGEEENGSDRPPPLRKFMDAPLEKARFR